jgi:transcriptional regulator with XRE-family HTH domain
VDTRSEIREFLTSRRAKVKPEQAGLSWYGENRRVPGLRREEVALLAGVSVDYYTRLERGNLAGVSETVLEALARALQLDEAERVHLYDLARASQPSAPRRRSTRQSVRPSVQWLLDSITGSVAIAENGRLDALATNQLGRAFHSHLFDGSGRPVNFARFVFLDPRAEEFFADWERAAKDVAALLRLQAGRNPLDRALSDLVGELSTRSEEFRGHWATHNVRLHTKGEKRFNHPVVGELELSYNRIDVAADPGLMIVTYTAEPGSRSEKALRLLASWAATGEEEFANADREDPRRQPSRTD